jgi:hypothetical protein
MFAGKVSPFRGVRGDKIENSNCPIKKNKLKNRRRKTC